MRAVVSLPDLAPRCYRDSDRGTGLLLGEGVEIGEGVSFGAYVVVHAGTVVGAGCVIEDHAVLGKRPRLARSSSASGEVGAWSWASG